MADSRYHGDGDGDDGGKNRISSLPDGILRILYFAGMSLAMQGSILSNRWWDIRRFMPHLNFNVTEFFGLPLAKQEPLRLRKDDLWVGDERFRINVGLEELELCHVEYGDAADCLQTLRLLFHPWKTPHLIHYLVMLRTLELWNCRNYTDQVLRLY